MSLPLLEILQIGIAVVLSFIVYFKYIDKKVDQVLDKVFPPQKLGTDEFDIEDDLEEL